LSIGSVEAAVMYLDLTVRRTAITIDFIPIIAAQLTHEDAIPTDLRTAAIGQIVFVRAKTEIVDRVR
jgi:hypothetical protein